MHSFNYRDMESEQPEVSTDQAVNSDPVSQNNGNPKRKWNLTNKHPLRLELDKTCKRIQDWVGDIMSPLGKRWVISEKERRATDEDDSVNIF